MSLFFVSRAARADLKNIAAYTQQTWGAEQRRTYIKDLDLTFLFLAENPMSGTPCDYIISGLRKHSHEAIQYFMKIKITPFLLFVFFIKVWMLNRSLENHNAKIIRPLGVEWIFLLYFYLHRVLIPN